MKEVEERVRSWKEGEAIRERVRSLENEEREANSALVGARWKEAEDRLRREEKELEGERDRQMEGQGEMIRLLGLRQDLEREIDDKK